MNQYIISQWFEYKDDLKSCFEGCVSDAEHTHRLFRNKELDYADFNNAELYKEVLIHLLKVVINRGKNSMKLKFVDSVIDNIPDTCCYDVLIYLRDKNGYFWMIDAFYGTFESLVPFNRVVATKEQWVTLLMHLSLGMVQRLRRCDESFDGGYVVLRHNSFNCSIKCLVDLTGLSGSIYGQSYLSNSLMDLPRKSLEPLFALMTEKQKTEIEEIFDEYAEEGRLSAELLKSHYPERKLDLMGMGNDIAWSLAEKIADFGLKGYFAICFIQYCPPPIGYYHEHCRDNLYEKMAEYANKFKGDIYFVAVGNTMNALMHDIEKKSLEFQEKDA